MSPHCWNSPGQMKKSRRRMLVRGNRITESYVPQILEGIGKCEITRITRFPEAVALGKFFRRKRRKSQQIVGAVFNHVDAQFVASVDAKIRASRVAQCQPIELHKPVEG